MPFVKIGDGQILDVMKEDSENLNKETRSLLESSKKEAAEVSKNGNKVESSIDLDTSETN